jgi:hypothetical protein
VTRVGVAIPVVSPYAIESAPADIARATTCNTLETGSSPSYGQPQAVALGEAAGGRSRFAGFDTDALTDHGVGELETF